MSRVLSHLHDSNANIAEFTSKFNGENKHVIRFIFDIQRYEQITDFQNPHTLFTNIYNKLPAWIQYKFAQDRTNTITTKVNTLTEESSEQEKLDANKYTVEDMQRFFIRNYRPTCKRTNIFRLLYSIKMRYNENPRTVVDRIATAVQYAEKTIKLINDCGGEQIQTISDDDITTLLANIFCNTNNCTHNHNRGGINELMQKAVRKAKPAYSSVPTDTAPVLFSKYYEIASQIVSDTSGKWYARDKHHEIRYYDPQPLPLWETVVKKPTANAPVPKPKPKPYQPKYDRNGRKRDNPFGAGGPSRKRPKSGPQSPSNPKPYIQRPSKPDSRPIYQCFRCGFRGHKAEACLSWRDINNQRIARHERRELKDMPFKSYKPRAPRNPTNPKPSPVQPTYPHIRPPTWNQYPSNPRIPKTPSKPNSSPKSGPPSNPQIHALIAELGQHASNDLHVNPDLLQTIQSLQAHFNTDTQNPNARQS